MPGTYTSLYQYVENRYANTVVLTFAHIEDLLDVFRRTSLVD
jgi:hypothetical protein